MNTRKQKRPVKRRQWLVTTEQTAKPKQEMQALLKRLAHLQNPTKSRTFSRLSYAGLKQKGFSVNELSDLGFGIRMLFKLGTPPRVMVRELPLKRLTDAIRHAGCPYELKRGLMLAIRKEKVSTKKLRELIIPCGLAFAAGYTREELLEGYPKRTVDMVADHLTKSWKKFGQKRRTS
ncbi:MAG: hypothetical protein HOE11_01980 [Candidatus Diapherotrites archaeon]|jgi:hypothetical protein|nr:hypothetical protein [Candidatus Diapherotrites archaeon]MBT4596685.1 hypothetical protein [Candidatus Diapherotrites archaeon]